MSKTIARPHGKSRNLYLILLVLLLLAIATAPAAAVQSPSGAGLEMSEEEEAAALARYLRQHGSKPSLIRSAPRPMSHEGGPYVDESNATYIGREFTPEQFAAWFKAQYLGAAPYNAIGVHHTAVPTASGWYGTRTLGNIFDWYKNERGWPQGVGPHVWLYDGSNPNYKPGQQLIYVATHPRHDGIGISYRNRRYLHIESVGNYDKGRMSLEMEDLYRHTLQTLSDRRGGGVYATTTNYGRGVNNPATWQGFLFHRDAGTDAKSCPGATTTHDWFDGSMSQRLTTLTYGTKAVVVKYDLKLRSAPDWAAETTAVVPVGTQVRIRWMTTNTQWRRVLIADTGESGFLYAPYLQQIE